MLGQISSCMNIRIFLQMEAKDDLKKDWRVMRQDDNGNRFVVRDSLCKAFAEALSEELTRRGHKQFYWPERMPPPSAVKK